MFIDCLNIIDFLYLILFDILIFFFKLFVKFYIKIYSCVFFFLGERVIRYRFEMMAFEILVNFQLQILIVVLKNFFSIDMSYKYLVFVGFYMEGSGVWVLQDDIFFVFKVVSVLNDFKFKVKSKKFCV